MHELPSCASRSFRLRSLSPEGRGSCIGGQGDIRMSVPLLPLCETNASITDRVSDIVLERPTGRLWLLAFALSFVLTAWLGAGIAWLLARGVGIWGLDMPVAWAFAIADYVWWIAIGMAGTFISGGLYL